MKFCPTPRVPPGQRVEVRFTTVSFGTQETCETDFVEIYDVPRAISGSRPSLTTTFCGNVSFGIAKIRLNYASNFA